MIRALQQLIVLAVLAGAGPLAAQTAPVRSDTADGETVRLSPFLVSESASGVGRYTSLESTSAGRVRIDIMDSSQSVSVITNEVLQDAAARRVLDAVKYIAGVSESSTPLVWDRTTIRGFLSVGRTVDGITYRAAPGANGSGGPQNIDPAIIDRIEVVKGPNSILAPQASSLGGTIDLSTKKPQFRDFGAVNLQWGEFDANSGFIDVNQAVNDALAVRVVGSARHWDSWWKGAYVHATTLMPACTWRFSHDGQMTLQYIFSDWTAQNYLGLPIDPTSGTTTKSRLLDGVPRDLNVFGEDAFHTTRQHAFKFFVTSKLWRDIQMRLLAAYATTSSSSLQVNTTQSTGGTGGSVDPLTGNWNYGVTYGTTRPYAPSPLKSLPTRFYTRSGTGNASTPPQFDLQNDYVYILENEHVRSTTLAGFAHRRIHGTLTSNLVSLPPFDIDNYIDLPATPGPQQSSLQTSSTFWQGYVSENLAVLENRMILNAALSRHAYDEEQLDRLTGISASSSPNKWLPSCGVVIKPWGDPVSLFYGYTEQSSANSPSTTGAATPPLSTARQNEIGVRFKVRDDRLYVTASYYTIVQDNIAVPDPSHPSTPPPLYLNRTDEGWETEVRANPTRSVSILASYTRFRNRDPNNVRFVGVAEEQAGLLASYAFGQDGSSALSGFRVAVGVDHLGRRPGDTATGLTIASTPTSVIPKQPTFYLASQTVVNLTLAYNARQNWSVQVNVDNVLDREYLLSASTRYMVIPGTPRNVRVSVQYHF